MATTARKKAASNAEAFIKGAREMIRTPLNVELGKSYMTYSMSVVYARALPDALDGLKPVQRRVLYAMYQDGLLPGRDYVKAARPVSTTMGSYHPHGDSSIYDAMAKLAQPWYLNVPFVDGYGNWGDATGSPQAAARYTECRLDKNALLLLDGLRENTVDMRSNYDGKEEEPVVLPVQFPVLLVNGTIGIAVGFSSTMAPHNPGEVIDATRWLLTHPTASLDRLMEFIPGPDFPTGGELIGMDEVRKAYETGQGKVRLRATAHIEPIGRGKHEIIFTDFPYQTNIENLQEGIKKKMKEGKLQGLADAKDLTDYRNGTRFVVESKAGINPQALLADLYANTALEVTFAINNVALVKGNPRTLGLKEIIELFIEHRIDVVTRRTNNRLDKRTAELHLLDGLWKALADIDKVIRIVRAASDSTVARDGIMKAFKIDETQADYILEIPLRRLTRFDQIELEERMKKLRDEIAELEKILADPAVLRAVIAKELDAAKKQLERPRRTKLIGGNLAEHLVAAKEVAKSVAVEVEDGPSNAVVYADGTVRRIDGSDAVKAAKVGTKLLPVIASLPSTVRGKVIFISNKGRGYRVETLHLGDKPAKPDTIIPDLGKDEKIIAVAPADGELGYGIFFATRNGTVKIANPDYPKTQNEFDLIGLEAGDSVVAARWISKVENGDIFFVTSDASLLRIDPTKVRPQGRTGGGMAGIKLAPGQQVLAAAFVPEEEKAAARVVTYTGMSIKSTPTDLYPAKGRATGGVRAHAFLKGEDKLTFAYLGVNPVIIGADGKAITTPAESNKRDGSGTKTLEQPVSAGY